MGNCSNNEMLNGLSEKSATTFAHSNRFDLVGADSFGMCARRVRNGPETQLVNTFLQNLPLNSKRDCRITVFQEPKLQSGFPDIVAVFWHVPTAMRWDLSRERFSIDEFRLVHILATLGPQTEGHLELLLQQRVCKLLIRLSGMGLISEKRGLWRASSPKHTLAVRRIVAFEAKISDWRTAIAQAALNKWFTSESYILLPRVPKGNAIIETARKASVGIWLVGEAVPFLECPSDEAKQPISYASWLFNEWAWRFALEKDRAA